MLSRRDSSTSSPLAPSVGMTMWFGMTSLLLFLLLLLSPSPVLAFSPTDRFYTGQIQDGTGLYYYNARYYDPQLGIFTSADRAQGPNRYAYVNGNPIMRSDPTGNFVPISKKGIDLLAGNYPEEPKPITNSGDFFKAVLGYAEFIVPDFLIPDNWGGKDYISKSQAFELQFASSAFGMVGIVQATNEVSQMSQAGKAATLLENPPIDLLDVNPSEWVEKRVEWLRYAWTDEKPPEVVRDLGQTVWDMSKYRKRNYFQKVMDTLGTAIDEGVIKSRQVQKDIDKWFAWQRNHPWEPGYVTSKQEVEAVNQLLDKTLRAITR